MLNIRIMPVTQWPGKETKNPKGSTFRSGYKDTLKLLEYELSKCSARLSSLILEMWVDARLIRQDGQLRADARVNKQGVIFRFTRETNVRPHPTEPGKRICTLQPVSYPCDAFDNWQDNLRAIALSMEALRSRRAIRRFQI
jgi:hypothetical protein